MAEKRFSAAPALDKLKDFQRKTVEYVFQRFYGSDEPASRFLVADEVGLGKTLVAAGIVAKTLEYLQDRAERIDVIYICSNASIAAQNINRLKVSGSNSLAATRLTYLPGQVRSLHEHKVNFISFTPGTTFDQTHRRGGTAEERAILFQILVPVVGEQHRAGLANLLQATAGRESWTTRIRNLRPEGLDAELSRGFREAVQKDGPLLSTLVHNCEVFARYRRKVPWEDSNPRYDLIGKLRSTLAEVCLSALRPNLVILDEFQRFKDLLDSEKEESLLAQKLVKKPGAKVLLLSATPYKMFTLDLEAGTDNHYTDFLRTLRFLFNDCTSKVESIQNLLSEYRADLRRHLQDRESPSVKKAELESALLEVMCRTERVMTTRDHNSMLQEAIHPADLVPKDLHHAKLVDAVASEVHAGNQLEYWKSAPYLVNFLKEYELGRKLNAQLKKPGAALRENLSAPGGHFLKKDMQNRYKAFGAENPKMRVLFADTLDKGMWKLLWMPPSMPYMVPDGLYKGLPSLTKALVFSAWNAVPDSIATLCSYEAERRMIGGASVSYGKLAGKFSPRLRFNGRPTATNSRDMTALAWLLPSPALATAIDPLAIALREKGAVPARQLRAEVKAICRKLLKTLPPARGKKENDERWYWAAPMLLDTAASFRVLDWCKNHWNWESDGIGDKTSAGFQFHLDHLVSMAEGGIPLGRAPKDLADVLCDLALGAPGVCALRALRRIAPTLAANDAGLLSAAARIASGFRTLFNLPETIALIPKSPYWRVTLHYCINGNLQAVLDEYVHVLRESLGFQEHRCPHEQVSEVAKHIQSVLSLRPASLRINEYKKSGAGFQHQSFSTRCRFALRFGDIRDDNTNNVVRADTVRNAFNSPFRPFVLASTSIGQEGLDFHTWCHAVVHWNLPANPVDLEQREGRVHRYKGHAVRKNVVERYGLPALANENGAQDPWATLFRLAAQQKQHGLSDLIPYWIFEEGAARVERRIPLLPFSKDVQKLKRLKHGLALYRLVFGQPRQEDLLFSLGLSDNLSADTLAEWMISLQAPEPAPRKPE